MRRVWTWEHRAVDGTTTSGSLDEVALLRMVPEATGRKLLREVHRETYSVTDLLAAAPDEPLPNGCDRTGSW